jgi:hypothetical protein
MDRLGFTGVGGGKTEGASVTTWWNRRGEQGVRVETRDGRAASIESRCKGICRQGRRRRCPHDQR